MKRRGSSPVPFFSFFFSFSWLIVRNVRLGWWCAYGIVRHLHFGRPDRQHTGVPSGAPKPPPANTNESAPGQLGCGRHDGRRVHGAEARLHRYVRASSRADWRLRVQVPHRGQFHLGRRSRVIVLPGSVSIRALLSDRLPPPGEGTHHEKKAQSDHNRMLDLRTGRRYPALPGHPLQWRAAVLHGELASGVLTQGLHSAHVWTGLRCPRTHHGPTLHQSRSHSVVQTRQRRRCPEGGVALKTESDQNRPHCDGDLRALLAAHHDPVPSVAPPPYSARVRVRRAQHRGPAPVCEQFNQPCYLYVPDEALPAGATTLPMQKTAEQSRGRHYYGAARPARLGVSDTMAGSPWPVSSSAGLHWLVGRGDRRWVDASARVHRRHAK